MTRARGGPYEYKISLDEGRRLEEFLDRDGPDDELFVTSGDVIARAMGVSPGTAKSWLSGTNDKGAKRLPPGIYRDKTREKGMRLRGVISRRCLTNPVEQREAIDLAEYDADLLRRVSEEIADTSDNVTPLPARQTA